MKVRGQKAREREAFEKKVEAGDGTPLEQAKSDAAIAQAKVRKIQEDRKIEKAREKAERAAARAAPSPLATAEEQPKRAEEASATEPAPKRRRKDPKATAAPKTEAREYKVGDRVVVASEKDGREMDGLVKSKEKNGYHRVWVQELDKTILRKLPQRAASSK